MESSRTIYKYVLEGDPIPLARCRISHRWGHLRVFDSQKELKLISQITLKSQHGNRPLFSGPLRVDAYFYFHIPRSHKKTKPGYFHIIKPDGDNLVKMILDLGNGVLFKDDCIVSQILCSKMYDDHPRTEFYIYKLENHGKKKEK